MSNIMRCVQKQEMFDASSAYGTDEKYTLNFIYYISEHYIHDKPTNVHL